MINFKKETLEFIGPNIGIVKCAFIEKHHNFDHDQPITLSVNKSCHDFKQFIDKLDFFYDNGFGGQEYDGTIWFNDGSWATRGEYDGSEWWELQKLPNIPGELL